jgi:hypothetical protein
VDQSKVSPPTGFGKWAIVGGVTSTALFISQQSFADAKVEIKVSTHKELGFMNRKCSLTDVVMLRHQRMNTPDQPPRACLITWFCTNMKCALIAAKSKQLWTTTRYGLRTGGKKTSKY